MTLNPFPRSLTGRTWLMLALAVVVLVTMALGGCIASTTSERRNNALISLGVLIFADRGLSADGQVSCASCHVPSSQFADGRTTSRGANGLVGTRNALSLQDVAFAKTFFWDGRESNLEEVVLQPFTNAVEMGLSDHEALLQRLAKNPAYPPLVEAAFGDASIGPTQVAQALTAFLQSLPVPPTRFDRARQSSDMALTEDEHQGLALFEGKAACVECHRLESMPASFTDHRFHHTGIGFQKVAGNIQQMLERLDAIQRQGQPIGQAILSDADVAELGRFAVTRKPEDLGAFRTPTLRNVARTAPYMHDGSVPTLEQAVERELYYRGLARGRPISLTVDEQRQLVAFLNALNTMPEAPAGSEEVAH